jgi:mevalonate kinase
MINEPSLKTTTYNITTHAKWIFAGEHAVLRGAPAIVMPLKNLNLSLQCQDSDTALHIDFHGPYAETLRIIFWGTLKEALEFLEQDFAKLTGKMDVTNHIPMGTGLGFSAALCVAIARWCAHHGWLTNDEIFMFARKLEDSFHSTSSGIDIAGVMHNDGVAFTKPCAIEPLTINWQPQLYLSYSDENCITAKCIHKVKHLWQNNQALGEKIDADMCSAANAIREALTNSEAKSFNALVNAINLACDCFQNWGLINSGLQAHLNQLRQAGAVAVKPCGAGDGGYVLSLWQQPPPNMPFELIKIKL